MEKISRYDVIEVLRDGTMQVRLKKLIIDDEGNEHEVGGSGRYHRFVVPPGVSVDEMATIVNKHLGEMGVGAIDVADVAFIKALKPTVQTPEKIKAYADRLKSIDSEPLR